MDNRAVATECYKQALQCDVYSYEAFEALVQNQMLSASEGTTLIPPGTCFLNRIYIIIIILYPERELLASLPFPEQCTKSEEELLRLLYDSKLKKYQEPNIKQSSVMCNVMGISVADRLTDNLDMQVAKAEKLYYNCDYHQCFSLTEK
jgi:anaphase-promoting complex subunit 6